MRGPARQVMANVVAVAKLLAATGPAEATPALEQLLAHRPEAAPRIAERPMTRALVRSHTTPAPDVLLDENYLIFLFQRSSPLKIYLHAGSDHDWR